MNTVLDLCCGISWSLVYLAAIIGGVKHKTWYIPKLAICMNFSWELGAVFSNLLSGAYGMGFAVQLTWLILDIGVLATWLVFDRNGNRALTKNLAMFVAIMVIVCTLAFEDGRWLFPVFLINVIESAEFIWRKQTSSKYTCFISIMKCIGTLFATILNGIVYWNPLVLWLGGLCFILDFYYLYNLPKRNNKNG